MIRNHYRPPLSFWDEAGKCPWHGERKRPRQGSSYPEPSPCSRRSSAFWVFFWGLLSALGALIFSPMKTFGAEAGQAASWKSKSEQQKMESSAFGGLPGKTDSTTPDQATELGMESPWLTELLREQFQRWLNSRSEAFLNQLQAEFGRWLSLRASDQIAPPLAPDRPAWIEAPAGLIDGQYWQTIKAGPAPTPEECQQELRNEIQKAVAAYAEKRFGTPLVHQIAWQIDRLLEHQLLYDQWQYRRLIDFGPGIGQKPMYWLYGRLQFNLRVQKEIEHQYRQAIIQRRIVYLGEFGTGLLVVLALSYGILRWQCHRLFPPTKS